jgi:hypothetical protein
MVSVGPHFSACTCTFAATDHGHALGGKVARIVPSNTTAHHGEEVGGLVLCLALKVALRGAEHGGPAIGVLEDIAEVKVGAVLMVSRLGQPAQGFVAGVRWDSDLVGQVPEAALLSPPKYETWRVVS